MDEKVHSATVAEVMRQVNQAWLEGLVDDLLPLVHPDIVMVTPGFAGRVEGREDFMAGFRDFSQNATVHEFREMDQNIDLIGSTAVVTFRYEMVYDYAGEGYRATGRDLWVFQKQGEDWLAVWRAMFDVEDQSA